jgi:hypothetical protein
MDHQCCRCRRYRRCGYCCRQLQQQQTNKQQSYEL